MANKDFVRYANKQLNRKSSPKKNYQTPQGTIGYDNPRENIDPYIRTRVVSTKEILSGARVLGDFEITGTLSGGNIVATGDNLGNHIATQTISGSENIILNSNKYIGGGETRTRMQFSLGGTDIISFYDTENIQQSGDYNGEVDFTVYNANAGASAGAAVHATTDGGGDCVSVYQNPTTSWMFGIDQSDSNKFKIHPVAFNVGSNFEMDTNGNLTISGSILTKKTISGQNIYSSGSISGARLYATEAVHFEKGLLVDAEGTFVNQVTITIGGVKATNATISGANIADNYISGSTSLTEPGLIRFGAWTSKNANQIYQAETDGFVIVEVLYGAGQVAINTKTDGNNPPTTIRGRCGSAVLDSAGTGRQSSNTPVRKGDYWKAEIEFDTGSTYNVYWLPNRA